MLLEILNSPATMNLVIQLLVVVLGSIVSYIGFKLNKYLMVLKAKDQLHIIDKLTDIAVEYVEKEYTKIRSVDKKHHATILASNWLLERGITVSSNELSAAIENGVNKLKMLQK